MTSTTESVAEPRLSAAIRSAREWTLTGRQEAVLFTGFWFATAVWVWLQLDQGWVGHDDGAFAQSAARVLDGQLPHREFADLYTGGLTFVNAAVMALFGEDLMLLRYPLFVAFLFLVPATYYLARQFAHPITALLAAVTAATWSIPVYPAAVPSWYLLVFGLCAAACLVRWRQSSRDRWLLASGVLAGISICFKIVGLYFVVAAILFLLFVHRDGRRRHRVDAATVGGLVLAAALVVAVLGSQHRLPELLNFVIPIAAVSIALAFERMRALPSLDSRPGSLGRSLVVFGAGIAVPLAAIAVPYVVTGSLGDLVDGVFLSPQGRRDFAYHATPSYPTVFAALVAAVVLIRTRVSARGKRYLDCAVGAVVAVLVVFAGFHAAAYAVVVSLARGLAPVVAVLGSFWLVRGRWHSTRRRELVFLMTALVAFTSLVQFPFGVYVYYCYLAPFVVLAAVSLLNRAVRPELLATLLLGASALFGAVYVDRVSLTHLAVGFVRDGQTEVLDRDRASVRVYPSEAAALREVVRLLRRHGQGPYTFAGPDLPQVYYLADLENPTRSLFDFLDLSDSARGRRLLETLDRKGVAAIAINRAPQLSAKLDLATIRSLAAMYPHLTRVGGIDVRWRASPTTRG